MTIFLALLGYISKLSLFSVSLKSWFGFLLGKGRIRHVMFPLLLFAGYKAYGHIFFPVCLAMEGLHGILATTFEHQAAALSAISTIGAAAHPKELGLLLASQVLCLEPSWH